MKKIRSQTILTNGVFTQTNNVTLTKNPQKRVKSKFDPNTEEKK